MEVVGRAMHGQTDVLKRYGITIDKSVKGSLNILRSLEGYTTKYEDVVQSQKKTIAWQLDNLKNTVHEKWAQFVSILDKFLSPVLAKLNDLIAKINIAPVEGLIKSISSVFDIIKEESKQLSEPLEQLKVAFADLFNTLSGFLPTADQVNMKIEAEFDTFKEAIFAMRDIVNFFNDMSKISKELKAGEIADAYRQWNFNNLKRLLITIQMITKFIKVDLQAVTLFIEQIVDTMKKYVKALIKLDFKGMKDAIASVNDNYIDLIDEGMVGFGEDFERAIDKFGESIKSDLNNVKIIFDTASVPKEVDVKVKANMKNASQQVQKGVDEVFDSIDTSKAEEISKVVKKIDWTWINDLQDATVQISGFRDAVTAFSDILKDVTTNSFTAINKEITKLKESNFAETVKNAFDDVSNEMIDFAYIFKESVAKLNTNLKEAFTSSIQAIISQAKELKEKADFTGIFSGMIEELNNLGESFREAYVTKLRAISFNISTDQIPNTVNIDTALNLKPLQEKIQNAVDSLFAGIRVPVDKAEEIDAAFKKIDWSWTSQLSSFVNLFTIMGSTITSFASSIKQSVDRMNESLINGANQLKQIDFATILSSILNNAIDELNGIGEKFSEIFVKKLQNISIDLAQTPDRFELAVEIDSSKAAKELQAGIDAIFASVEVPAAKAEEASKIAGSIDWSWLPYFKEASIGMNTFKESFISLASTIKTGLGNAISKIAEDVKSFKSVDFSAEIAQIFKSAAIEMQNLVTAFEAKLKAISFSLDTSSIPDLVKFSVGVDFSAVTEALQAGVDALFKAIDLTKAKEATAQAKLLDWSWTDKLIQAGKALMNFNNEIIAFKDNLVEKLNSIRFTFNEASVPKSIELAVKISIEKAQAELQNAVDRLFSSISIAKAEALANAFGLLDFSWIDKLKSASSELNIFRSAVDAAENTFKTAFNGIASSLENAIEAIRNSGIAKAFSDVFKEATNAAFTAADAFKDALISKLKAIKVNVETAGIPSVVEIPIEVSTLKARNLLQRGIDEIFNSINIKKVEEFVSSAKSLDWNWIDSLKEAAKSLLNVNDASEAFIGSLKNFIAEIKAIDFKIETKRIPDVVKLTLSLDTKEAQELLQKGVDKMFVGIDVPIEKAKEANQAMNSIDWSWIRYAENLGDAFNSVKLQIVELGRELKQNLESGINAIISGLNRIRGLDFAASVKNVFDSFINAVADELRNLNTKLADTYIAQLKNIDFSVDALDKVVLHIDIDSSQAAQALQAGVNALFNSITIPAEKVAEATKVLGGIDWSFTGLLQTAANGVNSLSKSLSNLATNIISSVNDAVTNLYENLKDINSIDLAASLKKAFNSLEKDLEAKINDLRAFKDFSKSVTTFQTSTNAFNRAVETFARQQQNKETATVSELKTANRWLEKINSNLTGVDAFA